VDIFPVEESMPNFLSTMEWMNSFIRIVFYFIAAGLLSILFRYIARQTVKISRFVPKSRKPSPERQRTVTSLVSNAITILAFFLALILSLSLYIRPDTLAWIVGLFSAAFGLGASPFIKDYLAGLSFIFEDTFAVGEKVELPGYYPLEGVIESINLRTTLLRATSGELFVVPNGEIRTVRNFSRGKFSLANITLKILSSDIGNAIAILEPLGNEAVFLLPNLIEPWLVISPNGIIGQYTELSLVAKARFGKAAEMRTRLLKLVHERLAEENIILTD
jgi:small conductance mechanosensitive channel